MQTFLRAAAILGVITFTGLAAASTPVDLTGWWRVVGEDLIIKFIQQGTAVTILDSRGEVFATGTFINDTLKVFETPTDSTVFVYTGDTLSGSNQDGTPLTLVRHQVDLNGWWKGTDWHVLFAVQQHGVEVTLFEETDSIWLPGATFANDTLLIPLPPPLGGGNLLFVYAADTLRGMLGDGVPAVLVRAPYGQFIPTRCGTITVDGNPDDWSETFLVADDPNDDGTSTPAAELDKLYLCYDSDYYYFRIDCVGDAAFPHTGTDWDRYGIGWYIEDTDTACGVRIDELWAIYFWNNLTQQETRLEAPGVDDHTIEGRIPLAMLGVLAERARVEVKSAYYDWDFGWQSYDEIDLYAVQQACGADKLRLAPSPQYALWINAIGAVTDTLIIGNFDERGVGEIHLNSLLINGAIQPTSASRLLQYPGFAGGVVRMTFPAGVFLRGYGLLWDTALVDYTVSGRLSDNEALLLSGQVPIIGHRSGDVNGDGSVNVGDAAYLIAYVFRGGRAPQPIELGDIDCNGAINVADVTRLVTYVVRDGPPPCDR